jgi:hypothetical protein
VTAAPGSITAKNQALANPEDQYAIALGKERTRIDTEKAALKQKQATQRVALQQALDAATAQRTKAESDINAELLALKPMMQSLQPQIQNSAQASASYDALMQRAKLLQQGLQNLDATYTAGPKAALTDFDASSQAEYDKTIAPMEQNYSDAVTTAQTLRDNSKQQSQYDKDYATARTAYDNAVTQHDKDLAAFQMYTAKKGMYDQDSANRQADIDAGRYAVNPYQFLAQGASLDEINKLRDQVNAGNLRPNMRVPDAEVAPDEVKDPGQFDTSTAPTHQQVAAPTVTAPVAQILGYKAPAPPKADDPLPVASTAATDTSSVQPGYTSPTDKNAPKTDDKPKDASGNPVINQPAQPQGAATLQTTSTTANTSTQSTPQTQTAAQAATPAPALAPQASGAVGGQSNSTGQNKTTPSATPVEDKPAPFTPDEKKKDEQDGVFQN